MRNNDTIKLLKLQGKNIILSKTEVNSKNNIAKFYISKKIFDTSCPHCGAFTSNIHDHREQEIKHIPINGFKTYLVLTKTRLFCNNCNKSFLINYNDIVTPKFRCSNVLFNKIIDDLQYTSATFKEIAEMNFVSPNVIVRFLNIFANLMQWNNISSLPKHIGIDEFKGNCNNSKYLFHVYDLDTKQTIHILESRKTEDIIKFFNTISNRNEVELVTMDLYSPFKNAVQAKLKNALIVADRFHYTRIVAKALDELRLKVWREVKGQHKIQLRYLKKVLLKDIEKVPEYRLMEHEVRLNEAFEASGTLKYGYQLYQSFLRIKDVDSYKEKCKLFKDWLDDAMSSTITSFSSAADTLLKWNKEILNSFKTTYTNSSTEGKNNKIKVIKRTAYGFRNLENFRNRIKIRNTNI